MREIKFRALLKAIEGGELHWEYYEPLHEPFWLDPTSTIYTIVVDNLQFTGLKDRNEKEIWEGDVVRFETLDSKRNDILTGVVEFTFGRFMSMVDQGGTHPVEYRFYQSCCEVLGNIYEHPHLLKEAKDA